VRDGDSVAQSTRLRSVLGVAIVVLVIGHEAADPSLAAFQAAAQNALGKEARIRLVEVAKDPPDEESVARAGSADGIVELSWTADGSRTLIHCYLAHERRWLDRQITFGAGDASSTREAQERGRLLGFAVATMFSEAAAESSAVPASPLPALPAASAPPVPDRTATPAGRPVGAPPSARRSLEFGGQVSSGLQGTAAGIGAAAALRAGVLGPLWARVFVAGRSGSIPAAQATTRTALLGVGSALAWPFSRSRFELGVRTDLFVSYFDTTHLSEDDVEPDRRSRWLPGADLVAEGGFQLAGSAGIFLGLGVEGVLGKTEIYTHTQRTAVVPPFRAVGEMGFRIGF